MSAPVDTSAAAVLHVAGMLPDWRGECPSDALDDALLEAAALLRGLLRERDEARAERDGANALVERMHAQDVLAIQAWQKAHPGEGPIWPSSIRLSAWCMGEVANLRAALATVERERDEARAERDTARGWVHTWSDACRNAETLRLQQQEEHKAALATARADALREAALDQFENPDVNHSRGSMMRAIAALPLPASAQAALDALLAQAREDGARAEREACTRMALNAAEIPVSGRDMAEGLAASFRARGAA